MSKKWATISFRTVNLDDGLLHLSQTFAEFSRENFSFLHFRPTQSAHFSRLGRAKKISLSVSLFGLRVSLNEQSN